MTATILYQSDWDNFSFYEPLTYDELVPASFDSGHPPMDIQNLLSTMEPIQMDEIKSECLNSVENSQESRVLVTESPSSQLTLHSDLICGVCGAPATGYNFDQVTCESCKAFFRRNALRGTSSLKCRFSGSCVINIHTRRQCTYCRLKKCFDIKMRKEWIRTEAEVTLRQIQKQMKQERRFCRNETDSKPTIVLPLVVRKKKRLMRRATSVVQPMCTAAFFCVHRNLNESDNSWLNNITHAYQITANQADGLRFNCYNESMSLIQFVDRESSIHRSLVEFFTKIPIFKEIDLDDRVRLIKSNLLNIVHLHDILIQNFSETPIIGYLMSKWINPEFHQQMSQTRQYLYRFCNHPLILKLALITFVFSIYEVDNCSSKTNILDVQHMFIALLWRYLNAVYDEKEAIISMDIITRQILRYQLLMTIMEGRVRSERSTHVSDALMQSIFRLT
ncbi:unnamed protein product [Adineta ricciae]|uniref:Nuclear receptor domain-containing protein n=1 Tax=Adineta ricciae TaxID=249248 RepID=A0A814C1F7_ADIRI|nr:unnamed protein product [Adineta ricciae]CAF1280258.1 unnamed protein product [Adineta ricciae]